MKLLVAGCGSIGRRHLKNLKELSAGELLVFDADAERSRASAEEFNASAFTDFSEALARHPDTALICTPTSKHMEYALAAARSGCHLFIEKPISHSMDGVQELIAACEGRVVLVGCNFRFDMGLRKVSELIAENRAGRVLFADAEFGQYLPDWHPWEDYRKGYSANSSLGGGIILDSIHELDYLYWLFGDVREVCCKAGKLSDLEIDVEDIAEISLRFTNDIMARVHMDYLQRAYTRRLKITGEKGTIEWDFAANRVRLYDSETKCWQECLPGVPQQVNAMYIEEMKHFISCIRGDEMPLADARDGRAILGIALAARESARDGRVINLAEMVW